jgi:transposase
MSLKKTLAKKTSTKKTLAKRTMRKKNAHNLLESDNELIIRPFPTGGELFNAQATGKEKPEQKREQKRKKKKIQTNLMDWTSTLPHNYSPIESHYFSAWIKMR